LLAPHSSFLVPLSARSPEALTALARSYQEFVAGLGDVPQPQVNGNGQKHAADARPTLADLCHSTSLHRTHHEHRLALVSHSVEGRGGQRAAVAAGDRPAGAVTGGGPPGGRGRLALAFGGQGPQWWAMGRQLPAGEPVFRDMIRRCDTLLQQAAREGGHAPW